MDHARAAISNLVRHISLCHLSLGGLLVLQEERFNHMCVSTGENEKSTAVLGATVWVVSQMSP